MKKNVQLGQLLINNGYIDEKQLQRAIEVQKKSVGKRLGQILVDMGYITERNLLESLAERLGLTFLNLHGYPIDLKAAALISSDYARRQHVLPIDFRNNLLVVATDDPLAYYTLEEIHTMTGYEISTVVATREDLDYAIDKAYSVATVTSAVENINKEFENIAAEDDLAQIGDRVEGTPVVKLINTIMTQAVTAGASDIHIEPTKNNLEVRLRINGDLVHHATMSMAAHNSIVTRIKLLSDMNIAEKRVPQDGKFHFSGGDFETDIRTSSLPTIYGEKVVLRLLGGSMRPELMDLKKLGMDSAGLEKFMHMVKAPNGIILVTGPTGSGKTTTLYATLNRLAQRKANIVTIEDPVEQRIDTVNQVQVNTKAGLTFATALRSILRQDPDIIMVGEMRDSETAELGVRAAITGHLVLSTIHTNDAVASVARLVDMGIPPYMVAAALSGIVAQRLVKTLCPHCSHRRPVTETERVFLSGFADDITEVNDAVGCEHCNYTGYSGRAPIYEIISMDETLRDLIARNATGHEIRDYEKTKGTAFLKEGVIAMVRDGKTSVEEIEKIIFSIE